MILAAWNGFQWSALIVIALLLIVTARAAFRGGGWRRDRILWMTVWILAGAAVAWPRGTVLAAHALGIGRGTDFVLYCAVLAMLAGFLFMYVRLQRLNREITLLTRHLALSEAEHDLRNEA